MSITAEGSAIIFNIRPWFKEGTTSRLVVDGLAALSFLGYRMGVLFPRVALVLYSLVIQRNWYELFYYNQGALTAFFLHIYWTYDLIMTIISIVNPSPTSKKIE